MKKTSLTLVLFWISIICISQNKKSLLGTYAYISAYHPTAENMFIVIEENKEGKLQGRFYGTTDELEDVREGYYPGYFVTNMDSLYIDTTRISFKIKVSINDSIFTNPFRIYHKNAKAVQNDKVFNNPQWKVAYYSSIWKMRSYEGVFSQDTIFFREQGLMSKQNVIMIKEEMGYDKLFYKLYKKNVLEPIK